MRDYQTFYGWPHSKFHRWAAAAGVKNHATGDNEFLVTWATAPAVKDDTVAVRCFLENVGGNLERGGFDEVIGNEGVRPLAYDPLYNHVGVLSMVEDENVVNIVVHV